VSSGVLQQPPIGRKDHYATVETQDFASQQTRSIDNQYLIVIKLGLSWGAKKVRDENSKTVIGSLPIVGWLPIIVG
jgi:hypothetical protein